MRLVQTLLVRDEADIVGHQIAYHLDAGVDFVIASDHDSQDGTTDVLESFARDGQLLRIPVQGPMQDGAWRTHMARLAATEYGADWIINTDADEFWMPRRGTLKDVLGATPEPYGIVFALSRHFSPRQAEDELFAERMTVRVSPPVAINDPTTPYRPHVKAAHRADPEISVSFGAHNVWSARLLKLYHWHPADVLHFPFRSLAQWENKGVRRARGDKPLGQYVTALRASEAGKSVDRFLSLVVDDVTLDRGLNEGSLAVDTRLRDALRRHAGTSVVTSFAAPDPGVVSEGAAVRDADLVRLNRHLDHLAARVSALERPSPGAAGG